MGAPIKESDDNSDRDSSFVSKGTRDASLQRLLLAFGVAGTTMVIVILFAYLVSSNTAISEFQDESTPLSSEPAYAEESIIEPEHLVEDVLATDIQEPAEIFDREEQSRELEEIFPSLSLEGKNTAVVVNATTNEIITIPLYDNLTATAVDASEEIKAEDPIDEHDGQLPVHDDGEDATGEQSKTIEDGDDSDDLDVPDDVTDDYPKDDDDRGRHERPEGHEKGSDDDRGKGKKNNHSRKE